MQKGKMEVKGVEKYKGSSPARIKSPSTNPEMTPGERMVLENSKLAQEMKKEDLRDKPPQPIFSKEVVQGLEKPPTEDPFKVPIDLSPISFGKEYDNLPIINVSSVLPSGGMTYPSNYEIKYRPLTFGEINKISQVDPSQKDLARVLLAGMHFNFPTSLLTYYDFRYIALLRKLSSLGENWIRVTVECGNKKCRHLNTFKINAGPNGNIEFWEVQYPSLPITVSLKFQGDNSEEYRFNPLTLENFLRLVDFNLDKDQSATLAASCISHPFEETYKKINVACCEDDDILREVDDLLVGGIKPIPGKCEKCGKTISIRIDSGDAIIRPFRSDENFIKDRIRFGD